MHRKKCIPFSLPPPPPPSFLFLCPFKCKLGVSELSVFPLSDWEALFVHKILILNSWMKIIQKHATIVHHHDSFISQSGKTVYGKLSFFSLFSLFVQQPSLQPSTSDFLGAHYISQHAVLCQPDSTSPQKHMFASQASSQQVKYYTITNISSWSQL